MIKFLKERNNYFLPNWAFVGFGILLVNGIIDTIVNVIGALS